MSDHRIGPYSVIRLIKEGGQGRVFLGYDRRLQRQVAIKVLSLEGGWRARQRALAEARKAATLNASQVVQIYDLIEWRGHLAIVMEYVPGVDLEDFLCQRRPSVAAVVSIAQDLAAALARARQQRVVHGDLKAANVLITRQGRAKLADFGVARRTTAAAAGGSAGALSPEQLRGQPLDVRSDLFALGCLLYRLLTGELPFHREGRLDPALLLEGPAPALRDRLAMAEEVPEALLDLTEALLQRSPEQRPQNTHPVRRQLREAASRVPLVEGGSLLREARPLFREERPGDIPPAMPARSRRRLRSALVRPWYLRLVAHLRGLRLSTRITVAGFSLAAVAVPIALAVQERPVRVHFADPDIRLSGSAGVPPAVGEQWLMERVYRGVEAATGPLHASGAVRPRAYFSRLAGVEPQFVVATSLRCSEALCVFSLSREAGDDFDHRQALIPPQLPLAIWEASVADTVSALFP